MSARQSRGSTPSLVLALVLALSAPAFGQGISPPPGLVGGDGGRVLLAQSTEAAQLMVRIQQLEEEVRVLGGQIEGLTFQLTQMQVLIARMQEDNERRFGLLEGASGAGVGPSQGPEEPGVPVTGLDLRLDAVVNPDADAQFEAAIAAMARGEGAFAEDQLGQFIALYPRDPRVLEAGDRLGQLLIERGDNEGAAELLLDIYQATSDDPRSIELLLKIGIALAGAGERDTACRTFAGIPGLYPDAGEAFLLRLEAEKDRAECPPG